MRFSALAVAEVGGLLIGLAAAVVLAFLGFGLAALVVQQLANAVVLLIVTIAQARWLPSWPRRTPGMRQLMSFGGGMAATQLLSYTTRNIDSIAIGRVWGPVELGLYDRAYRLSVAPVIQLNQPMTRVAMPVLSRYVDDDSRFVAALKEGQLIACYVTASALLVLAGIAEPLVHTLLGPDWSNAGSLLSILAIGATFRAGQQIVNWIFFSKGLSGSLLKFNLLAQPVVIIFILAGLPWGALGVAIGSAVGYAVYWAASFAWAARDTGLDLRPLMKNASRIIGFFGFPAGGCAWLAANLIPATSAVQLAAGLAAAVAWFALSSAISRTTRDDLRTLLNFIRLAVRRA
jgi:PST family polysaccharide transporter